MALLLMIMFLFSISLRKDRVIKSCYDGEEDIFVYVQLIFF